MLHNQTRPKIGVQRRTFRTGYKSGKRGGGRTVSSKTCNSNARGYTIYSNEVSERGVTHGGTEGRTMPRRCVKEEGRWLNGLYPMSLFHKRSAAMYCTPKPSRWSRGHILEINEPSDHHRERSDIPEYSDVTDQHAPLVDRRSW